MLKRRESGMREEVELILSKMIFYNSPLFLPIEGTHRFYLHFLSSFIHLIKLIFYRYIISIFNVLLNIKLNYHKSKAGCGDTLNVLAIKTIK